MAWLVREGEVLARLEVATTLPERSRGLLGRDGIDGALLLKPAFSVHTFGMRFPIDVAFCDRRLRVLDTVTMARNRAGRPRLRARCVLEAVAAGLATSAGVRAAYRALMQAGDQPPRLVVGVEVDDPDAGQQLLEAVGRAAAELGDQDVDLIAFGEDGDGAVGSWMQLHTTPFYRRQPAAR